MSGVASMPQTEPCPYRFSVEEFYKLGEVGIFRPRDRVELLDGEIIVMSPIGIRHVQAVSWLNECFVEQARRHYLVSPGNPVWLHDHSERQPDMMLVPRGGDRGQPRSLDRSPADGQAKLILFAIPSSPA